MPARLEETLKLVGVRPSCVEATFSSADKGSFVAAQSERGRASIFDRAQSPAVFIEVIHTLPNVVGGNHVHKNCNETLNVVSGLLELYLLCNCPKKHVFKKTMGNGETVYTPKGVPHALYTLEETETVVFFDNDASHDRDRVAILMFGEKT
jgi:uncharacterized RmlC-like cupin family protein